MENIKSQITDQVAGKFLLTEWFGLCPGGVCQDLLTEAEKLDIKNNKAVYLTGIMQRADAKNGNGRVYPYETLKREMDVYQKMINEHRALGECVDGETECLTKDGWKSIVDVKENEEIYTFNVDTEEMQLQPVLIKTERLHQGKMIHIHNKNKIDMLLTPEHKMILWDRYDKSFEITAGEFAENFETDSGLQHSYFRRGGMKWNGKQADTVTIGSHTYDADLWAAFLGIYLAEGFTSYDKKNWAEGWRVFVVQTKEDTKNEIRKLFNALFASERIYETTNKISNKTSFSVVNKDVFDYVRPLGKSWEKYIPEEVKEWDVRRLEILLEWMLKGDGRNRHNKKGELMRELHTTSYRLANDVSEIFLKLGSGSVMSERTQKDRMIEGRLIETKNCRKLYISSESVTNRSYFYKKFLNINEVEYDDNVYCVTVENKTWIARKNGRIFITHNCDHPTSELVELKNASHMITRTWWNGKDVMGTLKVLSTPSGKILEALVRDGVQVGISSRGLGTLTETSEGLMVEDDFELVCFDIVSEPSTTGAFMKPTMLHESKVRFSDVYTKADRINRMMIKILNGVNNK